MSRCADLPAPCRCRLPGWGNHQSHAQRSQPGKPAGRRRAGGPPARSGFGAAPANPRALLAEAEQLASAHALLGAQERLDAIESALGRTPRFRLIQGYVCFHLGQLDQALALLQPLAERQDAIGPLACTFLADACHHAGDRPALAQLLSSQPGWAATPEGRLFNARLCAATDPEAAVAALLPLAEGRFPGQLRRMAGFDAVKLLDQLGRHRQAWSLARQLQCATAPPFDLQGFLAPLQEQLEALRCADLQPLLPPAPPAAAAGEPGVAFVLGLPRSGTTLLEQMLDGHPSVCGIGEFQGLTLLSRELGEQGCGAEQLTCLSGQRRSALARIYRQPAQRLADGQAAWIVDKSLISWMWLPAIAQVMPGSVVLHLRRDPRDLALSLSMAAIRPTGALGWVSSLDQIRAVLSIHLQLTSLAIERLQLNHRVIRYESLVAQPEASLRGCLDAMHLPMHEGVLHPERNPRIPITLSHSQAREPIYSTSVGRWRQYDWLFGDEWEQLVSLACS